MRKNAQKNATGKKVFHFYSLTNKELLDLLVRCVFFFFFFFSLPNVTLSQPCRRYKTERENNKCSAPESFTNGNNRGNWEWKHCKTIDLLWRTVTGRPQTWQGMRGKALRSLVFTQSQLGNECCYAHRVYYWSVNHIPNTLHQRALPQWSVESALLLSRNCWHPWTTCLAELCWRISHRFKCLKRRKNHIGVTDQAEFSNLWCMFSNWAVVNT